MGRFDGYLLVSDMDGTLINSKTQQIDEGNLRAIEEFMAEGGLFAFASGRTDGELIRYDNILHSNTYAICFNGSCLYNFATKDKKYISMLGREILPFLDWVDEKFPRASIVMTNDDTNCIYRRNRGNDIQDALSGIPSIKVDDYHTFPGNWLRLAFWFESPQEADEFFTSAVSHGITEGYDLMRSYSILCEMMPKTSNKGVALEKLRELVPSIKTAVSVGDADNDLLMQQVADISFAPSNAMDQVKDVVDFVMEESCCDNVVAAVIEKLKNM